MRINMTEGVFLRLKTGTEKPTVFPKWVTQVQVQFGLQHTVTACPYHDIAGMSLVIIPR